MHKKDESDQDDTFAQHNTGGMTPKDDIMINLNKQFIEKKESQSKHEENFQTVDSKIRVNHRVSFKLDENIATDWNSWIGLNL